jgi:hypothetical protein
MPAKPRQKEVTTASERMRAYRARQRAAGLRPVQHWVPDMRNPKVRKEIERQAGLLDEYPETEAINDRLDAMLEDREGG